MIVTHKIKTDLCRRCLTEKIDVVQDDRYSRNLEFTLTENGDAWPIPEGTKVVIRYKKADDTGGNYDTLPDDREAYWIDGNVLTVALAPQVCTAPGLVLLDVCMILGEASISIFSVNIIVQQNTGADMISEDYLNVNVIARLEQILKNLEENPPDKGADGRGIASIQRTAGDGSPGTTDTYTITYTDGGTDAITMYNGKDGANGKSAYKYAAEGGYTGTESEFTSLLSRMVTAEEYTQDNWKVKKYSNGECELWETVEETITFSVWGNVYAAHNAFAAQAYPVTFAEAPVVTATLLPGDESSIYGYGLITGQTAGTASATPSFGVIRATAQSAAQSVRLSLYVKGTLAS